LYSLIIFGRVNIVEGIKEKKKSPENIYQHSPPFHCSTNTNYDFLIMLTKFEAEKTNSDYQTGSIENDH